MLDQATQDANSETGRTLGYDLFRFGLAPTSHEAQGSVQEGFAYARERRIRQETADRFVRKWLQLRTNAYRRKRSFDSSVTPLFLRGIDVPICPVTRARLTYGSCTPTDWSIDRLNNGGAYSASNLAVISTGANRAKGSRGFDEVFELSAADGPSDGLAPVEWLRMAALMLGPSFADHPRRAPIIPLATSIPNRTARPAVQIVQYLFTRGASTQASKNALIKRFKSSADGHSMIHLIRFAEAIHQGLKHVDPCWDVWLAPNVMRCFKEWRFSLSPVQWTYAGAIAANLLSANRVSQFQLQTWNLPNLGSGRSG